MRASWADVAHYKCDEQNWVVSYDSTWNENHWLIKDATLSTFHTTQNIYSYQNLIGYNKQSIIIVPTWTDFQFWTGDFEVSFSIKTTQDELTSNVGILWTNQLVNYYWGIVLQSWKARLMTYDTSTFNWNLISTTSINDWSWHDIIVKRVWTTTTMTVDASDEDTETNAVDIDSNFLDILVWARDTWIVYTEDKFQWAIKDITIKKAWTTVATTLIGMLK